MVILLPEPAAALAVKAPPTLSPARTLKEAMTWSAVSVSAVSRDMKSMKAWKVTMPILLGSTTLMMRENSLSPWWRKTGSVTLGSHGDGKHTPDRDTLQKNLTNVGGKNLLSNQVTTSSRSGLHTQTKVHTCDRLYQVVTHGDKAGFEVFRIHDS